MIPSRVFVLSYRNLMPCDRDKARERNHTPARAAGSLARRGGELRRRRWSPMSSRACGRRHGGRRISGTARRRPAKRSASADTPAADTAATPSPAEYSSPACYLHELESLEAAAGEVRIKRIYDSAEAADGYRALVDRLWPRGISRRRAALDAWLVELAPSRKLRLWFGHDPKRWSEFRRRYRAELRSQRDVLDALRERARRQRVTLLYG